MNSVLLIDDDVELCELVQEFLEMEGLQVESVYDGSTGLNKVFSGDYSLIVLDIMLPGISGLDVLRRIRAQSSIPVLLLSARGSEVDRIVGLELGSDDYVSKPCNPRELLARIRAILRRTGPDATRPAGKVKVGDVELDTVLRTVFRGAHQIDLTAIEFNILEILLRSAGTVVTRDYIAKSVFDRTFDVFDRSIDVHLSKLRKKLPFDHTTVDPIQTLRGIGYIYAQPLN
jgi:two-component system, OmpR family, response regulator CpxR